MELREKTLLGVGWVASARAGQQVVQVLVLAVLAHLLTPEDFGLIGMITVFTGFASLFTNAGLGAVLVQRKTVSEAHLSSVFWVMMGVGAVIAAAVAASSPLIAGFFGEQRLRALTVAIAFNFLIAPLNIVQFALLQRSMDFKGVTLAETVGIVASGAAAVVLAFAGFGVWSLVAKTLLMTAFTACAVWWVADWRPKLLLDWGAVRELLGYSGNLVGFQFVNYWVRQGDDLLIGKFSGSAALGIYTRAYSTMLLPISQITAVLSKVMFPALSRIQDDLARVKAIWLKANRLIGLVTIPLMFGLLVVAEPFVLTVFGSQWTAVVPILQVLCLVGLKQPVGSTTGWIYLSQGRTDLQFRWNAVSSAVTVTAFIIGIQWGAFGVAVAYAVRSYAIWYFGITIPGRLIDLTFGEFARNLSGISLCAALMAATTWGLGRVLPDGWPSPALLALQVASGAAVYWVLIASLRLRAYREGLALLREQLQRLRGDGSPSPTGRSAVPTASAESRPGVR